MGCKANIIYEAWRQIDLPDGFNLQNPVGDDWDLVWDLCRRAKIQVNDMAAIEVVFFDEAGNCVNIEKLQ